MFVRLASLLLFFNDYKLLPLCFTILISTLSVINTVESNLFEDLTASPIEIFSKLALSSIIISLVFVSLLAILHVHNIGSTLLALLLSVLLSCIFIFNLYSTISEKRGNV